MGGSESAAAARPAKRHPRRNVRPRGSRAAAPRVAARRATSTIADEIVSALTDAGTSVPPSPTTSETAPTSVATAGTPHSAASMSEPGMPSVELVERITSAACSTGRTSLRRPSKSYSPTTAVILASSSGTVEARRRRPTAVRPGTRATESAASPTRFSLASEPTRATAMVAASRPRAARAARRSSVEGGTNVR